MTYTAPSSKNFADAVSTVEKAATDRMFRVLHVHDVQATLAEKGFSIPPMKIVEVCNGKFAHEAIGKEVLASTMMPCRIVVYDDGHGRTFVSTMEVSRLAEFFPASGLGEIAEQAWRLVKEMVDAAR